MRSLQLSSLGLLFLFACSTNTATTVDPPPGDPSAGDDGTNPAGADAGDPNAKFALTYVGTGGYESKDSDLGVYEGVWVVRDAASTAHVAFGKIDGTKSPDSFQWKTGAVLERGHSYEVGVALRGRTECTYALAQQRHLYLFTIKDVQSDVRHERAYDGKFELPACDVIDVKTKLPAGVYQAKFGQSFANLVVTTTGRVYPGSMSGMCQKPLTKQCNGTASDITCTYPIALEEDGSGSAGASGNDLDFGFEFTELSDGFRFKGSLGGCCNEPFDVKATRIGSGPTECQ
jgi:hypothetical protein